MATHQTTHHHTHGQYIPGKALGSASEWIEGRRLVGSAEEDEDEVVAGHVRRQRQVVTLDLRGAGHANGGRCSVAVATTYT